LPVSRPPHELDVAEPVVLAVANLDGHVQVAAVGGVKKPGFLGGIAPSTSLTRAKSASAVALTDGRARWLGPLR
jgi:hypothetical protein